MKMKVSRNENASDFGTRILNSKDQLCSCKSSLAELGEAVGADEVLRMELLEERRHAATLDRRVARGAHVLALCLLIERTNSIRIRNLVLLKKN